MNAKFFRRALRSMVFRNRPYFAHLAITHRCNLKCRFCHVTDVQFTELDTEGMKRVIDVLDDAGVAVLSISGGGEPLLRDDFDLLINHASSRGLYVKLTSNGTAARAKYERLLRSKVDEIGISLDGVKGHDLPFSHVGTPILTTLQYLNDNLPAGKHLTINVTVSAANRDQVDDILKYCTERFPAARVWLNPVVIGEGALRTNTPVRTEPDYLFNANSPTLLKAPFYARGAQQQFLNERFDWECRAGELFFDVKPNGDYWLCQDLPSPMPLNVLDPNFEERRRALDKASRRACSGCVYSCYYVVQKSLEPRNWRDMGLLWWQANTSPGGAERAAADKYGPLGALACYLWRASTSKPMSAAVRVFGVLCLVAGLLAGQAPGQVEPDEVLTRMESTGQRQRAELEHWSHERTYYAGNSRLRRSATAKVQVDYRQPGVKSWRILSSEGSQLIVNRVIQPLLEAEQESAAPTVRRASDITRANYSFQYTGFDQELQAYVFKATPLHPSKFQFRGKIAVDGATYGVRRVWGEPAVRPSFWVRRTEFVHDYHQAGGFWLPLQNRTRVELRLLGRSELQIDYGEYSVQRSGSLPSLIGTPNEAKGLLP